MKQSKRILVCPLDWGLGHATRCIPVIRALLRNNAEVIIAADGRPMELLKQEFPELRFIPSKGYGISYPASGNMAGKMLLAIPRILRGIKREHKWLNSIIRDEKIDVVISDNRYGCWNSKVKSIFITHQLMIKSPFGENLLHKIILSYIKKYDECWIPDLKGTENLSGDLSHKYPLPDNAFFIGPLSRFTPASQDKKEYDVMAVVSGPEPQRSLFERLISQQIYQTNLKALIVFGVPEGNKKKEQKGNVSMVNHLSAEGMRSAMLSADILISRSGYSTIMDLAYLGKKVIFIPTPGQTEQEYLADYFMKKGIAYFEKQAAFDLKRSLLASENYSGFASFKQDEALEKRITAILS